MTVTATTFDTLAEARTLKLAGVEPEQAEAIADQLRVAAGADHEQLATKVDLSQLETRLTNRLYAVAAGIVGSNVAIAGVIISLRSDMEKRIDRVDQRMDRLEAGLGEVKEGLAEVRGELSFVRDCILRRNAPAEEPPPAPAA